MDFPRGPWKEKKAERIGRGVLAFLSMMGAALLGRFDKTRLPSEHLQDDTRSIVRLVASLFVVMTSLVLGFMINSAKNTYEANNRNTGMLATGIILLDRTIRGLGQEARRRAVAAVCRTAQRCGQTRRRARKLNTALRGGGWLSLLVGKALGFAGRGGALDLDTSHVRKQMYYFKVLPSFGRCLRPTRSMSTLIQK